MSSKKNQTNKIKTLAFVYTQQDIAKTIGNLIQKTKIVLFMHNTLRQRRAGWMVLLFPRRIVRLHFYTGVI